jgi:hypothetical protein
MKTIPKVYFLVFGLLLIMGLMMVLSVRDDTYTTDELLYLPTGYMYLTEQSMRLGFEHPPLVRDIAALPLLFINLSPTSLFWNPVTPGSGLSDAVWNFGENFLFDQTKPVEQILFWGRLPMILLTLLLGFFVFQVARKLWGYGAGFLALTLFVFSPLVLAHGRLVTTDVASALGAFLATYYFVQFLKKPTGKNIIISGIALGVAELIKFSLLLLFPFFVILLFVWVKLETKAFKEFFARSLNYLSKAALIVGICFLVILVVYQYHLWNYPPMQQAEDISEVLSTARPGVYEAFPSFGNLAYAEGIRALTHYSFGVSWQYFRDGAFAYFNGEGSGEGFRAFYPVGYLIKEPLPFHILTLLGLGYVIARLRRGDLIRKQKEKIKSWVTKNFFVAAALIWVVFYWFVIVFLNQINTGIRYVLPTLPFIYILVAGAVVWWLRSGNERKLKYIFVGALILFQIVSVVRVYPSFLAYFNESIGGPDNGYKYLVDTDLDWGQDAKRLAEWVRERGIEKIKIPSRFYVVWNDIPGVQEYSSYSRSYEYYLGEKYEYLPPATPTKGWVAIPARLLQWGRANAAEKTGWSSDSFRWLDDYEPVAKIGYSVFIYHVD